MIAPPPSAGSRARGAALALLVSILIVGPRPAAAQGSSGAPRTSSIANPPLSAWGVTPGEVLVLGRDPDRVFGASAPPSRTGARSPDPDALALLLRERLRDGGGSLRTLEALGSPRVYPGGGWLLRYAGEEDPERVAARLRGLPGVAYAGPNHLWRVEATEQAIPPDDPLYPQQTALFETRVPEAWARTRGAGMLIAIIDTGIQGDHPDLADRIAVNEIEAAGVAGVDDDGNGLVDDIRGYDFTDAPGLPGVGDYLGRDADPEDDFGHGTSVAGIVAASWNDAFGMAGVAPEAKILPLRASLRTSLPFLPAILQEDDLAAAIVHAAESGAQIINLSLGDVVDAPLVREAVRFARARGALVVGAAGNEASSAAHYPSGYPGVLVAGASGGNRRASFSNFGADLDLLAPGSLVTAPALGGGHDRVSGTSFSAPMVSGVAALVWSLHPQWSAEQVAMRVKLTARGTGAWNAAQGWGYLDAAAATEVPDPLAAGALALIDRAVRDPGGRWTLLGSVASRSLDAWDLVARREIDGASRLLTDGNPAQLVGDTLAVWSPAPADTGEWVLSLEARASGLPLLSDRLRVPVAAGSSAIEVLDLHVELQAAGSRGWDAVAWWRTTQPLQGRLVDVSTGRAAEEVNAGLNHGVRLSGPFGGSALTLRVEGRHPRGSVYELLADRTPPLPPAPVPGTPIEVGAVPPGTPYGRVVDVDGDFRPEVLLEAPPGEETYGEVRLYERTDEEGFEEIDAPGARYRGIPFDVADGDGDGRLEFLVFRVDAWFVAEAPEAGAFPSEIIFTRANPTEIPLGFFDIGGERMILAVQGASLVAFTPHASGGYVRAAEGANAAPGSPRLLTRVAVGDFDADGATEAAIADEQGNLVLFEFDGASPRWQGAWPGPAPLTGPLLAWPRASGGDQLLALEAEPLVPELEGDLDRATTRVRRWIWSGDALEPADALAFAGATFGSRSQLIPDGEVVLLRREGAVDRVHLDAQGIPSWGGSLLDGTTVADGALVLPIAGSSSRLLWTGSARGEAGVLRRLDPAVADPRRVPSIRVRSAVPMDGALSVLLELPGEGCAPVDSLVRVSDQGATRRLNILGDGAVDVVRMGEVVTYRLVAGICRGTELTVTGALPSPVEPTWIGPDLLAIDLLRPLAPGETGVVRLEDARENQWDPASVQQVRGGTRLLVSLAGGIPAPVAVVLHGFRDAAGLPPGGNRHIRRSLPAMPEFAVEPVLSTVAYLDDEGSPHLRVELRGADPVFVCPRPFVLDPGGIRPAPVFEGAGIFTLELETPLPPGDYTLRLDRDCLELLEGLPLDALARDFKVGFVFYPNPVPPGVPLTLRHAPAGTEVEIIDVTGATRASWRTGGGTDTRLLPDLSPGLYVLRVRFPDGRTELGKVVLSR